MKKNVTLLLALLVPLVLSGQNLNLMKQISGTGADYVNGMTTDASGNIYVVGTFTGTIDLDPGPGTVNKTASASDVWMAKYTSSGALVWGNMLTGGGDDGGLDIALDNSGNIYITGYYLTSSSAFDFDPSSAFYQPSSSSSAFIAKYTNNGGFVWAKALTPGASSGYPYIRGLAIDGNANIYITGDFSSGSTVDFDPSAASVNLQSSNGEIFYAKYNSSGGYVWAKQTAAVTGSNFSWDIALDGSNNIFITGRFEGGTDFNPDGISTELPATAGSAFVAKYNTNGTFQWAKQIAGQLGDFSKRCTTDGTGSVYLTGQKANGGDNIFLAKYSSSGSKLWGFDIGGANSDSGQALSLEGNSYIYVAGYFTGVSNGSVNFNPNGPAVNVTLPAFDNDFFVAKYNASDGKLVWVRNLDLYMDIFYEISAMRISNGSVVLAGSLRGNGDFNSCGATSNYSAATRDAFIVGFGKSDPPLAITGPPVVCSQGSYSFVATGVPPGATVSWSTNPSNLLSPSSGTGATFSTNAVGIGEANITASVPGNCGGAATKTIGVGNYLPKGTSSVNSNCSGNSFNVLNTSLSSACTANTPIYFAYNISDVNYTNLSFTAVSMPSGASWSFSGRNLYITVYTPSSTGSRTATVRLNATGPCGPYTVNFNATAFSYSSGSFFSVSPNPSSDNVIIRVADENTTENSSEERIYSVKISDTAGNPRKSIEYKNGVGSVDIPVKDLKPGMYMISIFDGTTWRSERLLIQK